MKRNKTKSTFSQNFQEVDGINSVELPNEFGSPALSTLNHSVFSLLLGWLATLL